MTDNKKLSQSSQEQFFNFFDASISPIQFEKWLFENPEVESCLGPEKYCALLSLSYHRKESISNVERLAETHLDIDKFYGPKIVLILERFIKSEWDGTSQLTSFLKVMDEIEEMYWKCPESLQEMFEDLLDREGAYQGLESRLESLSVDDEKWLILAFKKTVTASQRALCIFRRSRTVIPAQAGHSFRTKPDSATFPIGAQRRALSFSGFLFPGQS